MPELTGARAGGHRMAQGVYAVAEPSKHPVDTDHPGRAVGRAHRRGLLFDLPKIASYSDVLSTVTSLTWLEAVTLTAAAIFNLFTYWWQMVAAMPGLSLPKAAVNNQTTTTIANVLPGGGAIALGITIAMLRSWGYGGGPIALMISTTGHLEQLPEARPPDHRALPAADQRRRLHGPAGPGAGRPAHPRGGGRDVRAHAVEEGVRAVHRHRRRQASGRGSAGSSASRRSRDGARAPSASARRPSSWWSGGGSR